MGTVARDVIDKDRPAENPDFVLIRENYNSFKVYFDKSGRRFMAFGDDASFDGETLDAVEVKIENFWKRQEKNKFERFKAYYEHGWNPIEFDEVTVTSITKEDTRYDKGWKVWITHSNGKKSKERLENIFLLNESSEEIVKQILQKQEEQKRITEQIYKLKEQLVKMEEPKE